MVEIDLPVLECKRCGHLWIPRELEVRQCPKCKSVWWNKEKEKKEETENGDNKSKD